MQSPSDLRKHPNIRVPEFVGRYKVTKTLGKGGFAIVVLGEDEYRNDKVAIKIVNRNDIATKDVLMYFENELRLSSRFNHPNIVKIFDVIYAEDIIMIIMEYLPNNDLMSWITRGYQFSSDETLRIATEILQGMDYLHQRNIAHRDIKPENILFDREMHPKIIDFGLSKENSSSLHTFCGTPMFMAPEMISNEVYDGRKSDIWAFGITLHVMMTKNFPWIKMNEAQFIKAIQTDSLNIIIEPKGPVGSLIRNALVFDPKERPTCQELLDHIHKTSPTKITQSNKSMHFNSKTDPILPTLSLRNTTPFLLRARIKKDLRISRLTPPKNIMV